MVTSLKCLKRKEHTYLLFQSVNNVCQYSLLPPQLWCGHNEVHIMTKLLSPGDKDVAQLPTHCVQEIVKRIIFQSQCLTNEEGRWQTGLLKAQAKLMALTFFINQTSHLSSVVKYKSSLFVASSVKVLTFMGIIIFRFDRCRKVDPYGA